MLILSHAIDAEKQYPSLQADDEMKRRRKVIARTYKNSRGANNILRYPSSGGFSERVEVRR